VTTPPPSLAVLPVTVQLISVVAPLSYRPPPLPETELPVMVSLVRLSESGPPLAMPPPLTATFPEIVLPTTDRLLLKLSLGLSLMIAPPAPVLAALLENLELLTATEPHSLPMAPPSGAEFPVNVSSVTVT